MSEIEDYRTGVRAYANGLSAARNHQSELSCPYGPDDPLYYEWKRGFAVGAHALEEIDRLQREISRLLSFLREIHEIADRHAVVDLAERALRGEEITAGATEGE